jgi:hypothetical protein
MIFSVISLLSNDAFLMCLLGDFEFLSFDISLYLVVDLTNTLSSTRYSYIVKVFLVYLITSLCLILFSCSSLTYPSRSDTLVTN